MKQRYTPPTSSMVTGYGECAKGHTMLRIEGQLPQHILTPGQYRVGDVQAMECRLVDFAEPDPLEA